MSDIDRAVVTLREGREPKREIFGGWLYPAAAVENRPELTTAEVSDMPGYRYVLIDRGDTSDTGDVVRARGNIRPIPGWSVRVGTTRNRPWEYTILEVDIDMMGGEIDGEPQLEPHHLTHEFGHPSGGDDMVRPRFVQLYDFGGWPSTGTTVNIGDGVYDSDGTKRFLPYSNLPLTPWWPSAGNERWVVVCLSTSGTFEVFAGTEGGFVDVDDIPEVNAEGLWELFAAKLKGDETQVIMTPQDPGIVDLRFGRIGWAAASTPVTPQFGEIWYMGAGFATTCTLVDTYYQVLGFDTNGESNGATPDHTNGHITVHIAGRYLISFSVSCRAAQADHYRFMVCYNNGPVLGTEATNLMAHRDVSNAARVGVAAATGIVDLPADATVELWVENTDTAGRDIDTEHAILNVMRIEET